MNKEEANKTTAGDVQSVYPQPTRGNFSADRTNYAKKKQWAGGDPDNSMRGFLIIFMIVIGMLFVFAVKSLSGAVVSF